METAVGNRMHFRHSEQFYLSVSQPIFWKMRQNNLRNTNQKLYKFLNTSTKVTLNSISDTINLTTIIISVKLWEEFSQSQAFFHTQISWRVACMETMTRTRKRYTLQSEYTIYIIYYCIYITEYIIILYCN